MENSNINKKQDDDEVNKGHHAQQAALDASADMKRTQAWERLEKLISELHDFVQPKVNVHKEIKSKVASIGSAFRRLKTLEDTRVTHQQQLGIPAPGVHCTPSIPGDGMIIETTATDTDVDADAESMTGDKRDIRKAKRKQRTSPESGSKEIKKRKEAGPTPPIKRVEQPLQSMEWQPVKGRREKKEQRKGQPQEKQPRQKKTRRPVTRPNALIVRPKEKAKYAEILSRVKRDVPDDQVRGSVDKIRKTTTGDLLIIPTKETTDRGYGLQKTIADLLGDDAQVITKGPLEDIEIRDLDEMTTKEEVQVALQKAAGEAWEIPLDAIKSLRKAYGGTQTASVTLASPMVERVLGEHGKIRIG